MDLNNFSGLYKYDAELLPYVERVMKELPDLDDPDDIEGVAGELCLLEQTGQTFTAKQALQSYKNGLDNMEEIMNGGDIRPTVIIDEEKTAVAYEQLVEAISAAEDLQDNPEEACESYFNGITLDPAKEKTMERMNDLADMLSATWGASVVHYAQAHEDAPNTTLLLRFSPRAFMAGKPLKAAAELLYIADDFSAIPVEDGIQFTFGLREIWEKFQEY